MKKKRYKNKGILFWITGLSGTGKSSIGNLILPEIIKKYGPTILVMVMTLEIFGNLKNILTKINTIVLSTSDFVIT